MNPTRDIRNIALIGFMGTGKTSVGHLTAQALHFSFLDTDELIERMAGKRITEIFAQDGEPRFRAYEREIAATLETKSGVVISTGGGFAANQENLASLKKHALTVCLWASPETIFKRVSHQSHRPLLNDPDPLGKIRTLLATRQSFYRQADVLLSSDFRSAREVAHHVIMHFRSLRAKAA
ncbi:MAG TPA: shikimate kinase [Methylomirabilota bacterium]|nr:shikimate kinase [Methylomirabilota bacterium]